MSYSDLRLLAVLLIADGEPVSSFKLELLVPSRGRILASETIRSMVLRLRRRGVLCVENAPMRGYRMVGLPSDDLLDDVLAVTRDIRREHAAIERLERAS